MMFRIGILLLFMAALSLAACSRMPALTEAEQEKLDPALRALLMDQDVDESAYTSYVREDGQRAFSVILKCDDAEALEDAGIPISSVFGDVVTARLTKGEIRKAVSLSSVLFIETSRKSRPT